VNARPFVRPCALALLLAAALPLAAQQPAAVPTPAPTSAADEAQQREMQAVQELLARAVAEFEGPQQGRSISMLEDIVARLESLKRQGLLPPRGREMLVQAHEYRGRAYYNIGLQEKAADSFRSVIQLQPQAALSKDKVSPKIVEFFNSVKRALVGYLAVSSKPAGARVTLSGEFLGLTDFFPLDVLAGDYTVEISKEGYQTEVRQVSIAPRGTQALQIDLVRTMAAAAFVTEPSGVEIWIDGQLRATTAGALAPELFDGVRAKGLEPTRASARTEVAGLSLGSHIVEFRKKCHESERVTLDLSEPRDYEIAPVRLQESLASLQLKSDPPGARIYIDGEPMGLTPRDLDGICAGRHRIEVKHASGKFIQDIVLVRDESLALDSPIRPSLAFLGVVAESAAGERVAAEAEEKLVAALGKIQTLNFVPAPRETVDRILEADRLTRKGLVAGAGTDADVVRKVTEKLAQVLEVQGFLIAVLPEERLQRTARLHVLAAGNTSTEPWDVVFAEAASIQRFIAAVDKQATVYRPWTGLITVDTLLHEGVPVLRVVPGSPAAAAGLQPGEVLVSADGKPVAKTADLLALVAGKRTKETVSLTVKGGAGTRVVELTLDQTPQEIPLNDPALLYNKIMMDLRQQVEGYPGTEPAAFARLNLGLAAMHFADFAAAHDHLVKARGELPARPGLSQGTAAYYLGLSLERLGYRKEAADAYRAAAGAKEATLFNNDGPAVAPLAARRAGP
jgi:tetratricopeptide (TPR) repeat protein